MATNKDVSVSMLVDSFEPSGDELPISAVNSLHNAVMLTTSMSSECPDTSMLPAATA